MQLATYNPNLNYIGVEIRDPLVVQANETRNALQLENVHFVSCNFNIQLDRLLSSLSGSIHSISIFNPDPWVKKKHQKRRYLIL